jgi:hypothetical protein
VSLKAIGRTPTERFKLMRSVLLGLAGCSLKTGSMLGVPSVIFVPSGFAKRPRSAKLRKVRACPALQERRSAGASSKKSPPIGPVENTSRVQLAATVPLVAPWLAHVRAELQTVGDVERLSYKSLPCTSCGPDAMHRARLEHGAHRTDPPGDIVCPPIVISPLRTERPQNLRSIRPTRRQRLRSLAPCRP